MAKNHANNGRPNGVQSNNGRDIDVRDSNGRRNNVRSTNGTTNRTQGTDGRTNSMLDNNRGNNDDEDITLDGPTLTDLLSPQQVTDGSGVGIREYCAQTGGTFMGLNDPIQHRQQASSDMLQQSDSNMYQHAVGNMHRQAGSSMSMELAALTDYSPIDAWRGNASNEDHFSHIRADMPFGGQPTWGFYQPCTDD